MSEEQDAIIRRMIVEEGKSYAQVGEAIGKSKQRIWQIAKYLKITTARSWTRPGYISKHKVMLAAVEKRRLARQKKWAVLVDRVRAGETIAAVAASAKVDESRLNQYTIKAGIVLAPPRRRAPES